MATTLLHRTMEHLTHVKQFMEITEVREIDESKNRLPNSGESHTFHGRDIFAYTGARLASV